jgi:ribulose-5-phosphate 4-epimerase/fuculose-1-phosphate aldolase
MYEDERRLVARAVAALYAAGLITAAGGNVSVRLSGDGGYLITPSGTHKGALAPDDLVHMAPDRLATGGPHEGARPSIELPMHMAIYARRPDCGAVVHCHGPAAIEAGALGSLKIPLVPPFAPGTPELAEAVAAALAGGAGRLVAALLRYHGLVTIGRDLDEAAAHAVAIEGICRGLLAARPAR